MRESKLMAVDVQRTGTRPRGYHVRLSIYTEGYRDFREYGPGSLDRVLSVARVYLKARGLTDGVVLPLLKVGYNVPNPPMPVLDNAGTNSGTGNDATSEAVTPHTKQEGVS